MKEKVKNLRRVYSVLIVLLLVLSTTMLPAQTFKNKKLVFNCDFARFRNTSDKGYLEFYFCFSPLQVNLRQQDSTFRGGVNLAIQIRQMANLQPVIQRRYYIPVQLSDTSSSSLDQFFVSQRGYEVPMGNYQIIVTGADTLTGIKTDSIFLNNIDITSYGNGLQISDIELCSSIAASRDTAQIFYKNSLQVVPNPSLVFGGVHFPIVWHYLELYNLNKDSAYIIETNIYDQRGVRKRKSDKRKQYNVTNAVDVGTTTISNLPSGKYHYQVRILDKDSNEIASVRKQFFTNNPHIPLTASTDLSRGSEFLGMSSDELVKEFRMAQYIATDEEIRTFNKLTEIEGMREFLSKFWSEVERGRLGRDPVSRIEYLHRTSIVNESYRNMSREGWRTDRGRVYLLYGQPDDIQRYPSSENAKPYEIWEYHQIENGVIFVFVDRSGFGEYRLVHSTKRGELQDETWERNLR